MVAINIYNGFKSVFTEIIDVFRPVSLESHMKSIRDAKMQSDERKAMISIEIRVRGLLNGSIKPITSGDFYWLNMDRELALDRLALKYHAHGLYHDAKRLEDEVAFFKSNKKKSNGKKGEKKKGKKDNNGFVHSGSDKTVDYINPNHMNKKVAEGLNATLCRAELDAMVVHQPTLFEKKALKIKPFWMIGRTPEQTHAALSRGGVKGFSLTIVKYYFGLFRDHSEQERVEP